MKKKTIKILAPLALAGLTMGLSTTSYAFDMTSITPVNVYIGVHSNFAKDKLEIKNPFGSLTKKADGIGVGLDLGVKLPLNFKVEANYTHFEYSDNQSRHNIGLSLIKNFGIPMVSNLIEPYIGVKATKHGYKGAYKTLNVKEHQYGFAGLVGADFYLTKNIVLDGRIMYDFKNKLSGSKQYVDYSFKTSPVSYQLGLKYLFL